MKLERRSKIIELIGKYQIETQEELGERLEQEGFAVTQATISRDIRELKLTKVSVDGVHQKYTLLQEKDTAFGIALDPYGDDQHERQTNNGEYQRHKDVKAPFDN